MQSCPVGAGLTARTTSCQYRGCASTPLTSPQFYSAGYTGDYATAVAFISAAYPDSPLVGMGFSLGASVVARYMGEQGEACVLRAGMVLGCPWDIPTMSKTWVKLCDRVGSALTLVAQVGDGLYLLPHLLLGHGP